MTQYKLPARKKRHYLSEKFNPLSKQDIALLIEKLLTDIPTDFKTAAEWFGLFNEASSALSEAQTKLELNLSLNINNKNAEKELKNFEENILKKMLGARSELINIYISSPWRYSMHSYDHDRIIKEFATRKKYTSENMTSLQLEENQIVRDYKKFINTAKINFAGKSVFISAVSGKFHSNDSEIRESAFLSYWNFVKENEDIYQDFFDLLYENRRKQAAAANADSYVDVAFSELGRIDYGAKECTEFRNSILKEVVPVINDLSQKQKSSLGTESILPWDVNTWPALIPQELPAKGNLNNLIKSIGNIVEKIHPAFGHLFQMMIKNHLIDITSRPEKGPGAFCVTFSDSGMPFIFGNFSGTLQDAMTFLHEFGHAIHGYATSTIPNILLRQPGFEFCEFASHGLELLASPFLNELWNNPADVRKAQAAQLFSVLNFWPFMAMMDEWQHTLYSSKEKIPAKQRNKLWREISKKYRPHVAWSGVEEYEELGWLSRMHIFSSPFYYIDYGIAQIGAIQLWRESRINYKETVHNYMAGLSLGAQKSLPELFRTAGLEFSFHKDLLKKSASMIKDEIENFLG